MNSDFFSTKASCAGRSAESSMVCMLFNLPNLTDRAHMLLPGYFSDDDVEFLPLEEGGDGLDHLLGHADIRAVGAPCDVRGEHDAGNLAQKDASAASGS